MSSHSPRRAAAYATFVALMVAAVACGSESTVSPTPTATPAISPVPTAQPSPTLATPIPTTAAPTPTPTAEPPTPLPATATAPPEPVGEPAIEVQGSLFTWRIEEVDRVGIKPALALASDGTPHVAYMLEKDIGGWVNYARRDATSPGRWKISTVAEGYFYGPLDIDLTPSQRPVIVYHDHQDTELVLLELGEVIYASQNEDQTWQLNILKDPGHDGWDSRSVIDSDGVGYVVAVDPLQFFGSGIEFYRVEPDGSYVVEQIGSGPQDYKYAVDIAIDSAKTPYITYYDQNENDLALAVRKDSGWELTLVDTEGETGLFSSLLIDSNDRIHISFLRREGESSGAVMYATRGKKNSEWTFSKVDDLDNLFLSGASWGARNVTSLALGPDGNPIIAYGDRARVNVAAWNGTAWQSDTIDTSTDLLDRPLGHLVSLKTDRAGRPHLVWWELTSFIPTKGIIKYAVGTPR